MPVTTDRRIHWHEIEGWLSVREGNALQALATGKRVLELGSYKGRSTVCIARVAASVTSVDHHKGDSGTGPADTYDEFLGNIERAGIEPIVDPWRLAVCDFHGLVAAGHHEDYDLAFVDTEHTTQATVEALTVAMKRVKPGGVIAWHDCDYPDVIKAVEAAGLVAEASCGTLAWCTLKGPEA